MNQILISYCEERLGELADPTAVVNFSPDKVLERLWVFLPMFTARNDAIKATVYSEAFDDEADDALARLAKDNGTASWDEMSAGAWRVMQERLAYCLVVINKSKAENVEVMTYLPPGLDRTEQSNALLLMYLLGPARTIDRQLLPLSPPGCPPSFPADTKLRKQ